MIRNEDNLEDHPVLPFLIHPLTEARGQVQFCQILIANLFEKGEIHAQKNSPTYNSKDIFSTTISKIYVVSHHNMESTQ